MKNDDAVKMITLCLGSVTNVADVKIIIEDAIERLIALRTPSKRSYQKKVDTNETV